MSTPERQPTHRNEKPAWTERSSSMASVSVFLSDEQGRLLMVQDLNSHGGKWSPIAGYVDDLVGEEPEIAALREAKEELGLDIRLDQLLGVWHYYEKNGIHQSPSKDTATSNGKNKIKMHVVYAFRGTILDGTFTMQPEEIQNYGFFAPSEIEKMNAGGKLKTPEYNYDGFKLWENGTKHPLDIVRSNTRARLT